MKAEIVWIEERYWKGGKVVDIPEDMSRIVCHEEPYDIDCYSKYVILEVEG